MNNSDLRETPVGYKTSSIQMTANGDRALFFRQRNWDGGVMARQGRQDIRHVGRPSDGGKTGFNNDIRSIRLTNFRVNVVYHIIRDRNANFPGGFANRAAINAYIRRVHREFNRVWMQGFISFQLLRTNVYDNDRVFNFRENFSWLRDDRAFSLEQAAINVFVVNTRRRQVIGQGSRLLLFRNAGIAVIALTQGGPPMHDITVGRITAHEVGHVLGLGHKSAGDNPVNIMFPSLGTGTTHNTLLNNDQIERVHRRISRRGEGAAFRIE
jgi:hypothetical protein